jgi:integrase
MGEIFMSLTHVQIVNAKSRNKAYRMFDGRGLYVEISPTGGRWWRFKYRFGGKEKRLSFGVYPEVSLKEAREKLDDARKHLEGGRDPGALRKATELSATDETAFTFEAIAREWFALNSRKWAPSHGDRIIRRLELNIFPWLGTRAIREIKASELLTTLRRIEGRGAHETAHRALQNCARVFRYAVVTDRVERDIARDLAGALAPVVERHHASITDPRGVGALLRAIKGYQGSVVTKCALCLAPLVFVRPGELRKAEWAEFDFDESEWRIPAARMKMKEPHLVPLSRQSIAILEELRPLTGSGRLLFPGEIDKSRSMSDNTILSALRRLGYATTEMTGHGFRSMASTLLNEQGWNADAIERQLAHAERNAIRAAYNYADYLPERRKMMQQWADYLDRLALAAPQKGVGPARTANRGEQASMAKTQ